MDAEVIMILQLSHDLQIIMVHTYREENGSADCFSKLESTQQSLFSGLLLHCLDKYDPPIF
ncbi:hypothetical protein GIB67_016196 [Kingdonia uniflora]|uniref:Uncharacterized protein n=1 Tax=Kingdonia uniflora TaxID=39325 RepID=A0A7J7LT42_9MAGN|nr:hypothetical protein GIB67_016196 [Kingdonia uniflora]